MCSTLVGLYAILATGLPNTGLDSRDEDISLPQRVVHSPGKHWPLVNALGLWGLGLFDGVGFHDILWWNPGL